MSAFARCRAVAWGVALVALALMAQAEAAPGPEVPAAKPEGGYLGRLTLAPEHGPAGTKVAVRAEGLPAGQEFDLVWRTVEGSWKVENGEYHGRDYRPVGYRIATVKTDPAGTLAADFTAPEDFGFLHDIVVQQGGRAFIQAGFSLDMTVTMSPESGPVGTPITIDVKGIGWRQLENSWLLVYDNNFTGWISAVSTSGAANFTIPATGGPGTHVLQLIHGEFTFPYMNPQQNPVPDRPRFKLQFTVREGAVLPPKPELQAQAAPRGLPAPGELVAVPAFAAVGEPVMVRGERFAARKTYRLDWSTVTGNRVAGSGWEESAKAVAEATADADGKVVFRFAVPDDLGGAHRLSVDDGKATRVGSLSIVPTALPLDVAAGPAGTMFTIHLKGVGWTETANIYHLVYDNNYVGYACGFNSQGDLTVFLPATGAPGWHFVDLYPGIYKGEEVRPNNFRIPQLTYARDHPGEDLPHFRYAFEVTPDGVGNVRN